MLNASPSTVESSPPSAIENSESLQASLVNRTSAVLEHAVDELKQARALAKQELNRAIAGFRQIFTTVPVEMRSNVLLKQAWAVHQALEVVRSLDAALAHLQVQQETSAAAAPQQHLAA